MWLKAFHLFFMVAWFAGIFYLPRLFVNHAMVEDAATINQLKLMERKLYRFITPWMVLTLGFGIWILVDYGWAAWGNQMWLQVKLLLLALLVAYHFYCGKLVKDFENDTNTHSHVWYRWFNEIPVFLLIGIVFLAVLKPV